jgi:hypothetical protein
MVGGTSSRASRAVVAFHAVRVPLAVNVWKLVVVPEIVAVPAGSTPSRITVCSPSG